MENKPLVFAHIGDLHITDAKEQNYIDYLSIIAQIEEHLSDKIDFVFLPGDNADNGKREQYRRMAIPLKMLSVPVHVISGDHDMEQGDLDAFYTMPQAEQLPKSFFKKGINCVFLDVSGGGTGGPDFTVGKEQFLWLENKLNEAKAAGLKTVIFLHTYPDDFTERSETARFNSLLKENEVVFAAIGHTHYNEIASDGALIYAATRSTGQIEEGPVGYSVVSVDGDSVSWRFKPLHDAFPFVMITSPSDYRLFRYQKQALGNGRIQVRATVFGSRNIRDVSCRLNDGDWVKMHSADNDAFWETQIDILPGKNSLTVKASDISGRPGFHTIVLPDEQNLITTPAEAGSDKSSIGAWPENGIFGTQLGPNRNAKPF